jgi:D-threo-aldose 1-dehydrogenase
MVDPLCVGCAPLGDMPETFAYSVSEEQALQTVRAFFNGPINFLDTAASYGDGESERRIGVVLRELGGVPEGFVVASKADRDPKTRDFSGDQIRRSVERSLKLLGLNKVQLMYLHDPEHTTFENSFSKGGPVEALHKCKSDGLIDHVGLAGGPIDMEVQYVETGAFEVVISHNRFTLLNTSANRLWDLATKRGVACVNAAPYGSGMLAKGPSAYPRYAYQDADSGLVARARRLEAICQSHQVPLAAAALQFSLRDPRIVSTIVGMTRPERLAQTIDLAQLPIPEALWMELATVTPTESDPEAERFKNT